MVEVAKARGTVFGQSQDHFLMIPLSISQVLERARRFRRDFRASARAEIMDEAQDESR